MSGLLRRILSPRPRPPVEHLVGDRPHYIVNRKGDQWGIVVLHGCREIDWLTPKQARRLANTLIDLAYLASNPGELPQESHG